MIDAVLFEFDGVLADTTSARGDALRSTLREDGIALSADEYREQWRGAPSPKLSGRLDLPRELHEMDRIAGVAHGAGVQAASAKV